MRASSAAASPTPPGGGTSGEQRDNRGRAAGLGARGRLERHVLRLVRAVGRRRHDALEHAVDGIEDRARAAEVRADRQDLAAPGERPPSPPRRSRCPPGGTGRCSASGRPRRRGSRTARPPQGSAPSRAGAGRCPGTRPPAGSGSRAGSPVGRPADRGRDSGPGGGGRGSRGSPRAPWRGRRRATKPAAQRARPATRLWRVDRARRLDPLAQRRRGRPGTPRARLLLRHFALLPSRSGLSGSRGGPRSASTWSASGSPAVWCTHSARSVERARRPILRILTAARASVGQPHERLAHVRVRAPRGGSGSGARSGSPSSRSRRVHEGERQIAQPLEPEPPLDRLPHRVGRRRVRQRLREPRLPRPIQRGGAR